MVQSAKRGKQFMCSRCQLLCYRLIRCLRVYCHTVNQQELFADKKREGRCNKFIPCSDLQQMAKVILTEF